MQSFAYRVLLPDHAEKWQELRLEGARDFPLGFLVTLEETAAIGLDRCRDILGGGSTRGVFCDETLVGFCSFRRQRLERIRHRGEIGPFFVTRDSHGTGAAQALMTGVIEEARDNGLAQLELFVDSENQRAIAFYMKQGFKLVATHHDSVRINGQARNDHFFTLRL